MSTTIDPTQKNKFVPTAPTDTVSTSKTGSDSKPTLKLDLVPNGPKPDFTGFLAANSGKSLSGPGVSAGVFGAASPKLKSMSDGELATNLAKLAGAMKANPGKVNDQDLKNFGAMMTEAAVRETARLESSKPIEKMDNRELFQSLAAFDAAKASGMTLTKEQQARYASLEAAWKTRSSADMNKEVERLTHVRKELVEKMALHCGAAAAGGLSLATHNKLPAILGSLAVIGHAVHEGDYKAVAVESALFLASRFPGAHTPAEVAATSLNALECEGLGVEKHHVEEQIKAYNTAIASKAAKP